MIEGQNLKFVQAAPPQTITGGQALTFDVDTAGWDYACFVLQIGTATAALNTFTLMEKDTTGGTPGTVSGASYGSSVSLPGATSDFTNHAILVPLNYPRKRFLTPQIAGAGGGTMSVSCLCILSKGETIPYDAASRGLVGQILL